jgi:hypothetical protein
MLLLLPKIKKLEAFIRQSYGKAIMIKIASAIALIAIPNIRQ